VRTRRGTMKKRDRLLSVGLFEVALRGIGSHLEQIVIFSASKTSQLKGIAKKDWLTFL
jgi:hypothetical protein